jgi:hypothetical protein
MSSQAQLDANHLNSQKSTGPTSPEGKAASSRNALESGIDAHSEIIRDEDPAELEALSAAFHLEHHPTGATQLSLVDTLVSAEWTQRRLRRVEADLWKYRLECLDQTLTHGEYIDESIQHNSPLGQAYHGALDAFTRIQRRIDGTNRLYLRTLKVLQDLQALQSAAAVGQAVWPVVEAEQAQPVEPPVSEPPSPVEAQPLIPPIGFVPHFAIPAGKRPPASHENSKPLKIGQWANDNSSAHPKRSRPAKGHSR